MILAVSFAERARYSVEAPDSERSHELLYNLYVPILIAFLYYFDVIPEGVYAAQAMVSIAEKVNEVCILV